MDMLSRQSHLLHALSALALNKGNIKWTDVEHKVFDDIKQAVSQDTLLVYPNFNQRFDIHTDTRDY